MSLQEIDVLPDQQYIDQLKVKVKIQEIQESALLIQLCTISIPILLCKFIVMFYYQTESRFHQGLNSTEYSHSLHFDFDFRLILLTILFKCMNVITIIQKPLKYVIFSIHLITKLYILLCLSRIKIFESFFIVMSVTYLSIYCFLKTRDIIKGHNDLQVKYYINHIVTISFLTTFLLVQELYYKFYVIPLYWLFMILYMIFLLLNLQLVEYRQYLWENNDIYIATVLMDSDLIAPANLLKLQSQITKPQNHEEIKKQEVIEDSEIDELDSEMQD
ncbi:unnamed protein product (macronuclear) [Paramecium tetraurelia]|uniref:Transmembrane protein n=1 Tax=Paramecium tetraurelia TaxID=5888 RepID=A0EGY0_PARTE|nr:uncharacterized protein GSPATT00026895001 [Paramecium tetraurelia]CAK94571.1 unnamed protein product [Paramecium tetraurelia]|eukprot:XP_001461944.1 hypothetical protein (macronuclear) [Paramecium tetraurelia strain d4-2]